MAQEESWDPVSILSSCNACGTKPKFRDITVGVSDGAFSIKCESPWRAKNAAMNELGIRGPVVVLLCSDVCEERYGRTIGFWKEKP